MAPSVNSDGNVKPLDTTDSGVTDIGWAATLVQAMSVKKPESDGKDARPPRTPEMPL